MNNKVKSALKDSGWYKGRQIEIDYLVEEFRKKNFPLPNEEVKNFLKEFANIEINFILPSGEHGNILIVLDEILPYLEIRELDLLTENAKEIICPVGTLFNNLAFLYIGYSGKFYITNEGGFYLIGNSFYESLDIIINQKNIFRIGL